MSKPGEVLVWVQYGRDGKIVRRRYGTAPQQVQAEPPARPSQRGLFERDDGPTVKNRP